MRRHLDKLTGYLKIHPLHAIKILKILVEYIRNFNISDLYFIFRQKHKDQAERTVKVLKLVFVLDYAFKMKSRIIHYQ